MIPFDEAVAVHRRTDGVFVASEAPRTWRSPWGRPQGGLIAAQIMTAMLEMVDQPGFHPRAMTTHFLRSPHEGDLEIECTIERAGRTIINVSARASQRGKLQVLALAVFGTDRSGPLLDEMPMPDVDAPHPERITTAFSPEHTHPFSDNVIAQLRSGPDGLTSAKGPMHNIGWMGFTEPRPFDAPGLLVLCDAGLMPLWIRGEVLTTTIDYTVHFRADFPVLSAGDLAVMENRTRLVADGLLDWDVTMWSADGSPLCMARQQLITLED